MRSRHPLPRHWLMTDERLGDTLPAIVARLPRGSGVVFRHYATPAPERRALFVKVRRIARARRLVLLVAGPPVGRADGAHGRLARRGRSLATRPVHSLPERIAAERAGVDAIFVSPVFPTRSHPGAPALGRVRLGLLLRGNRIPAIALGGVDAARYRRLSHLRLHGWAAIDAWSR